MAESSLRKTILVMVYLMFGALFAAAAVFMFFRYSNVVVALMLLAVGILLVVLGLRRRKQVEGVDY